ncbi:MAG: hypothetical protein V4580_08080 [Bacteroidota bacterium]
MIENLKIKLIISFVLFCVTSGLLLIDKPVPYRINYSAASKEMFLPELKRLNSTDAVYNYADSVYLALNLADFDTTRYVKVVSGTVKRRFYHGLSCYSLSQNWICYTLGEICWSHISAIVNPDDILGYPEGLCSQQNIIFMEVLRKKGITTRTVGLGVEEGPGHFLCEVRYNNGWHLYDVDVEPNWKATVFNHESLELLLKNKEELYKIYDGRLPKSTIDTMIKKISYGVPNKFPAHNMYIFQKFTKIITYVLPVFFLLLFLWFYRKRKHI